MRHRIWCLHCSMFYVIWRKAARWTSFFDEICVKGNVSSTNSLFFNFLRINCSSKYLRPRSSLERELLRAGSFFCSRHRCSEWFQRARSHTLERKMHRHQHSRHSQKLKLRKICEQRTFLKSEVTCKHSNQKYSKQFHGRAAVKQTDNKLQRQIASFYNIPVNFQSGHKNSRDRDKIFRPSLSSTTTCNKPNFQCRLTIKSNW